MKTVSLAACLVVALALVGCSGAQKTQDGYTGASPVMQFNGPAPAPGMISYQQAADIAKKEVAGQKIDYDAAAETTVRLDNGRYIVTFPVPAGVDAPGSAYSARVTIDAQTGKVIGFRRAY